MFGIWRRATEWYRIGIMQIKIGLIALLRTSHFHVIQKHNDNFYIDQKKMENISIQIAPIETE